jgi:hypothetical protein
VTTTNTTAEDAPSLVYTCLLPLSTQTLTCVADLLRGHLKAIGSRWRKLSPGKIATIVVAVLRHDQRLADIAGGNSVSASTVRRWVLEVIELLAARAPRLDRILKKIAKQGGEVVLLDGTLVRTRRRTGADNRRNYSGKHKVHGLLVLALTDRKGNLLWICAARPGRASEITTARHNRLTARLREAGLGAIADLGFVGLDDDVDNPVVITGRKAARGRPLNPAEKQVNQLISAERAPVEHGFAALKTWRILTKVRMHARHATQESLSVSPVPSNVPARRSTTHCSRRLSCCWPTNGSWTPGQIKMKIPKLRASRQYGGGSTPPDPWGCRHLRTGRLLPPSQVTPQSPSIGAATSAEIMCRTRCSAVSRSSFLSRWSSFRVLTSVATTRRSISASRSATGWLSTWGANTLCTHSRCARRPSSVTCRTRSSQTPDREISGPRHHDVRSG